MSTSTQTTATQEEIDAMRPAISWVMPSRIPSMARFFLRRGFGATENRTSRRGDSEPHVYVFRVPDANTRLDDPRASVLRFYASGLVVVTGPLRDELADTVARLRAGLEAEEDDRINANQPRNSHINFFLE